MGRLSARARQLLVDAWLGAGRARARGPARDRFALVDRLAPGRSFLDLGGMWNVDGEVAFRAERAGASRVVLFDGMDPTPGFEEKHEAQGSSVSYVQGDLHDPEDVARLGTFDVVWCTGVIYHSPDPYLQLLHMRRLAEQWLLLGTEVIPEVPGIENACVFYPGRSPEAQRAFARAYGERAPTYPGMTHPFDETPMLGYANMWWGLSPSAVRSMLGYTGFEVREEFRSTWSFCDFLAEATGKPDFIPPLGASRARGEERLAALGESPRWAPPG
jgi:SAM-dependent methyltransferase